MDATICPFCEHHYPGPLCPVCDADGGPCASPTADVALISRAQQLRWIGRSERMRTHGVDVVSPRPEALHVVYGDG